MRLILSIVGLLFGFYLILILSMRSSNRIIALIGLILVIICGIYIVRWLITRSKTQPAQPLQELPAPEAKTAQPFRNKQGGLFIPQQPPRKKDMELKLYDTEKRLQGVVETDGTLYDAYGHERGKIAEMDQERCIVQNHKGSVVVFVKHDGRISSWNGSLGRVDPGTGLVYKHTGSGTPIGIVGKVSPLGDTFRMGAVASLLLSPFQMGE